MDKSELIRKYAREERDRVPFAQVLDKLAACERLAAVSATSFLSARQCELAQRMLAEARAADYELYGGYEGAERNIIIFKPEWARDGVYSSDKLLVVFRAVWSDLIGAGIGHRDFLGALIAAGIGREAIGDILPGGTSCDFITLSGVAPFIEQNFTRAGRATFTLERIEPEEIKVPAREVKLIRDTVATLRLDSVVASALSLSRERAAGLILAGYVSVDGADAVKPDKRLAGGEMISARGFGRFRLLEDTTVTKKNRIGIKIERYL